CKAVVMRVPRDSKASRAHAQIKSIGKRASRKVQATIAHKENCQPAQRAKMASAAYQVDAIEAIVMVTDQPCAIATRHHSAIGGTTPTNISGTKNHGKVLRRSRAQRTWRCQTAEALRQPSGWTNG